LQQLLLERFPDGATHEEASALLRASNVAEFGWRLRVQIREFLSTLASNDTHNDALTVLQVHR
jgi:hypothetical protein